MNKSTPSTAVKALTPDRFGGYGVVWGSPRQRDLAGEYFTPETDLALGWYDRRPALYQHGLDEALEIALIGTVDTWQPDEWGVWIEGEWARHGRYVRAVRELVRRGALHWSGGSAPNLVRRAPDGKLMRWPIMEWSMTPTPAEPRLTDVRQLEAAYKAIGLELRMPGEGSPGRGLDLGAACAGQLRRARALALALEIVKTQIEE
jgi:hypothetical protein